VAKRKVKPPIEIECLAAADYALGLLAEVEADAVRLRADLEKKIAGIRADAAARVAPLEESAAGIRQALEAWATAHPEEFPPGRRSLDLSHGRIGWRLDPPSVRLIRRAETVIAALRARRLQDAVIVRETVNKEVLVTYPPDVLAAIGARIVQKDRFHVDLKDERDVGNAEYGARSAE